MKKSELADRIAEVLALCEPDAPTESNEHMFWEGIRQGIAAAFQFRNMGKYERFYEMCAFDYKKGGVNYAKQRLE